jgi:hypothetical protein
MSGAAIHDNMTLLANTLGKVGPDTSEAVKKVLASSAGIGAKDLTDFNANTIKELEQLY